MVINYKHILDYIIYIYRNFIYTEIMWTFL